MCVPASRRMHAESYSGMPDLRWPRFSLSRRRMPFLVRDAGTLLVARIPGRDPVLRGHQPHPPVDKSAQQSEMVICGRKNDCVMASQSTANDFR